MDLVYIDDCIIPSRYANAIQVMKMCQAFARQGHSVTLLVPARERVETETDDVFEFYGVDPLFDIHKISRPPLSALGTLLANYRLGRAAASLDPDLVYGRSMIACYVASRAGLPTVWESHEPVFNRRFSRLQRAVFRRLIRRPSFERLVVISDPLCEHYTQTYPSLAGSVLVEPDGADPVSPSADPIDLGHAADRLQVGYVGHLYSGRGIDVILALAERRPTADFHIIGGNPEDVEHWEARAQSENVTFYGFLPPTELDAYRLAFDVQLAPYQRDLKTGGGTNTVDWMSPLKLFEYMAAGRAIVASDLPAIRDVLTDRHTALLCEPDSVDAWQAALDELATDADLRAALGRHAQAEFLEHYTWEERATRILEALRQSPPRASVEQRG